MAYRHRPALDLVQPPRHEDLSAAHELRDADRLEQADQGVERVGFPRRSAGSSSVGAEIHHLASVFDRGVQRGLRLSWIVYRSAAARVTFSPDQMKTWTDTRAYANSPWSPPWTIPAPPPDNKWIAQATFQEPGTYVLRAVASDGSIFTYDNVTVTVTR